MNSNINIEKTDEHGFNFTLKLEGTFKPEANQESLGRKMYNMMLPLFDVLSVDMVREFSLMLLDYIKERDNADDQD